MFRPSEVFVKYETQVSSRGVQCKKICSLTMTKFDLGHCEGDLCYSLSESEGRKEKAECHLHKGDGLENKRK